jgi:hypothetical protein
MIKYRETKHIRLLMHNKGAPALDGVDMYSESILLNIMFLHRWEDFS